MPVAELQQHKRQADHRRQSTTWLSAAEEIRHAQHELARIYYLDRQQHVIDEWRLSDGLATMVSVGSVAVLRHALLVGAERVAMAHNHPSGDHRPSKADIAVTRHLMQGCKALAIDLVDHVIMSPAASHSMRQAGLI